MDLRRKNPKRIQHGVKSLITFITTYLSHGYQFITDYEEHSELKIKCSVENCNRSYKTLKCFSKHLKNDHNIDINIESLSFNTIEEFKKWKTNIEDTKICQYVQRTSTKTHHNVEYTYYICHRSYHPRLASKGQRNPKSSGSVKIGKVCPSYIRVHKNGAQFQIEFCSTHLFHDNEIGKQRLHTEDRYQLAGKLGMGVTVQRVLNDVRNSATITDFKRIHLLEKRDIHNIRRDFKIDNYSTKMHENDFVSVYLWVEQIKEKSETNPVLYFKHQGEDSTTHLTRDDFCLILMTEYQAEMLKKFGCDKICVDGTHGLNSYNFQLYTLLVVDNYGNGFPVAFCFTNKSDTSTYKLFFECIQRAVGLIKANVFMSDDEPAFYNAWQSIMGPVSKQLLCTWHVLRNWSKNLSKIHSQEKKSMVYKTLKSLMHETDKNKFYIEITKVIEDLKNDTDTADFGQYFASNYSSRVEKWAFFNRRHVGINTNMYLEALHKNIKYCYLEGKQCRRLDLAINAVMFAKIPFFRDK
ncbi:uncharacterized protein LOC111035218 [Myzus persicae]|uniref:uncharacterized protein LOC111035218 n=1 Tax=Myzus persicae TaxID=13164 RepID=UPI000B934EC3|nr:uncharacterized protein LOC111035218 [Myzus persicae]